jgi:hypothetical protein
MHTPRCSDKKIPSLAEFIKDMKLAVGDKVLSRKRVLERLVQQQAGKM